MPSKLDIAIRVLTRCLHCLRRYGTRVIEGVHVPYWVAGDGIYPLRPTLIVPYPGEVNVSQRKFNHRHSSGRMVVEHTFGCLKGRWKILRHAMNRNYSLEFCSEIATSCAILQV